MNDDKFVEDFIKSLNPTCPKCGSSSVDVDWKDGEDDEVIVENICEDCNEEWEKHYQLVEEYVTSGEEE